MHIAVLTALIITYLKDPMPRWVVLLLAALLVVYCEFVHI